MKTQIKIMLIFACLLTFFLFPLCRDKAEAATVAGIIKKVKGESFIYRNGMKMPASKGGKLLVNDIVITRKGAVGIILRDNSVVAVGKNSRFVMKAFEFNPDENKISVVAGVEKGVMTYLSGIAAKMKKDAVKIETPHYVTCAIRGTRTAIIVTPGWGEEETPLDE